MRYIHEIRQEQWLPVSMEEAWNFFSSPKNLALLTPPDMDFKILSRDLPEKIYEGMEIEYRVRPLFQIPFRWKSRLVKVEAGQRFTDIQLKGPYSFWEHTHSFAKKDDGVEVKDLVRYKIPLGILGNLLHSLFIRKKLDDVFRYRKETLEKIFLQNA